jgi:hypothetical protein
VVGQEGRHLLSGYSTSPYLDGCIGLIGVEIHLASVFAQLDADIGVAGEEIRQAGDQPADGQGARAGQAPPEWLTARAVLTCDRTLR